ncbi:MAG: OmpH family outer membrane protein [Leptolyngbya sp. PLA1]|nr:OmpH family outer membrane protein [Leptolyngbya sp. PLA1]
MSSLFRSPVLASACVLGLAIIAGSALRSSASPAGVPAQIQPRVALVNLELINKLTELQDRNRAIAAHADQLKKTLDDMGEQIKAVDNELATVIPPTDHKRRNEKQAEKIELQGLREARSRMYQQIINLEQGDVVRELYLKLNAVVAQIAAKDGFDLVVLDDSSLKIPERATAEEYGSLLKQRTVLFRTDAMDITDRVLTVLNNEYAAKGGKP